MKRLGFTLVEIMVTVAIIAILAAIVVPNLRRSRMTSNEVMAKKALRTLAEALEQYYLYNGDYPADVDTLVTGSNPPYLKENIVDQTKHGYSFGIAGGAPVNGTYSLWAVPQNCGTTGTLSFTITNGMKITEVPCS